MIGFVFGEEQLRGAFAIQPAFPQSGMVEFNPALHLPHTPADASSLAHDHVLRNQTVGKSLSGAVSGPRFVAVILIRMSSASPLAYSTKTSK